MAIISWKEEYCVGDTLIDSQHQYLFELANAVAESNGKTELTDNAMKLFRYVREHFTHEEAVMRKIGYPAYRDHVAQHDDLITKLSVISSDIGKDQWSVAKLQQFMHAWLLGHVVKMDTKLSDSIHQHLSISADTNSAP